jgi:hemolysin III
VSRDVLEELVNSLTHGVGLLLSLAGLPVLVTLAALRGDAWTVVSCSVFGASLVLLYLASTLYHSFQEPRLKHMLRVVDHSAIYILIAGTYTPFTLVSLRGPWGWSLFGVLWGLALVGIIAKPFLVNRFAIASTMIYIMMGWIIVIAIKPVLAVIPPEGLLFLFIGGLAYTLGTIFFAWHKLPLNHGIWHLFVLTGSIFHFFAVMVTVIPAHA